MTYTINGCMGDDCATALRRAPIHLDFDRLITDEEPPQVVVVRWKSTLPVAMDMEDDGQDNGIRSKTDADIIDTIQRMKSKEVSLTRNLKDGGEKYRKLIQRHEEELQRRKQQKAVGDGLRKPLDSPKEANGVCKDGLHRVASAPSPVKSSLDSPFCNKMEGKMDSRTEKAFGKELSTLNRCSSMPSDKKDNPSNRKRSRSLNEIFRLPPKVQSLSVDNEPQSSGFQNDRKRTRPPHLSGSRKASLGTRSCSRFNRTKEETVVLLDEEFEPEETTQEEHEEQETLNRDTIIYYPSRNDSGSIEIRYSYMDCLAPQTYVSSTIMNFYMRYLQEQCPPSETTGEGNIDYHLFNTFFYEKLKDAVSNKKGDENSFAKLRRWWKNVNIFQKAYIFLPIHENSHWSLVIVCMPDKEDHSGLVLLHLDSLGIHYSRPIFSNIKSFLKEEWRIVKGKATYDVPIAESVWENLPRRIDEQSIEVPQQKNEYDCGVFVLYFMERFISDAPKRLTKKNLKMFGTNWFNPKDASSLRRSIRKLLEGIFKKEAGKQEQVLEEQEEPEASPISTSAKPRMNIIIE